MGKLFKILGKTLIVILSIPVALSIVLGILGIIIRPINQKKLESNFKEKLELRQEVIEKIRTGEIQIDGKKAILPEEYKDVTINSSAYVYVVSDDETVIEFMYHGGFPDEGQSFVYSSGGEALFKKYINESLYHYIEKFDDNWYFVQFK